MAIKTNESGLGLFLFKWSFSSSILVRFENKRYQMDCLRLNLLLLYFLCLAGTLRGQDSALQGKIIDSHTNLPVPFASIKIKSKMIGAVSNANGDFQIPGKFKDIADSVVVSCIGYTTTSVSFRDLQESAFNFIRLVPSVYSLNEVVVSSGKRKKLTALKVLNSAIANLDINYPQEPFSYIGYYRDYQLLDTNYFNLNEAIVEIYDEGFLTDDFLQTAIDLYEYKLNTDFPRDSSTARPYDNEPGKYGRGKNKYIPNAVLSPLGGNELGILRLHDAIRNNKRFSYSFVDVFIHDFEKNHFLKMEESVNLDSISLYCISFRSKYDASGPRNFATGKLFIEEGNFAIHKIEYSTYNKTMKETQLMYNIQTEYARTGPYMYLNYISFNNGFKTHNDTNFKVIEITYNDEKKAFVLDFNTIPEELSVTDTSNYVFIFEEKPLHIHRAQLTGERQITLFLEEPSAAYLTEHADEMSSRLTLRTKNIRDVDNRELDKITNSTVFQFRELFVQKIFPGKPAPANGKFINKSAPLSPEVVSSSLKEDKDFWMNSPLRAKQ